MTSDCRNSPLNWMWTRYATLPTGTWVRTATPCLPNSVMPEMPSILRCSSACFSSGMGFDVSCTSFAASVLPRPLRWARAGCGRPGNSLGPRLACATADEIRQWFGLPDAPALEDLTSQLLTVLTQTGNLLQQQGFEDFESLCRQVLKSHEALDSPAATAQHSDTPILRAALIWANTWESVTVVCKDIAKWASLFRSFRPSW